MSEPLNEDPLSTANRAPPVGAATPADPDATRSRAPVVSVPSVLLADLPASLAQRWRELRQHGSNVSAEELCSDWPDLAGLVKERLDALASMKAFVGAGKDDPLLTTPPLHDDRHDTRGLAIPFTAPGYEILGELGRGGMGVVYKARQVGLDRVVALKMILEAAVAGSEGHKLFKAEAEAVARLQHPHIVQIHEIGEHDGHPFFSLEFCPGGSLADKLAGKPIAALEAAAMVQTLANAVEAAHVKGVVHRDLKPANVLLAEDGALKVTDFGLAKRLDQVSNTQNGAVMGTPNYMAPEQAAGKVDQIGPVSDVYALGAILYECLTGRPPFLASSIWDLLVQVQTQEPVSPRALQSKTPRDLATICLKCLEKERGKRYPSARDLADDLGRFLKNEPIRARPVSARERLAKWARREPTTAGLVGVSFLAFLLGIGAVIAGLFVSNRFYSHELQKTRAHAEARRSSEQSLSAAQQFVDERRYLEAKKELDFAGKILDNQPDMEADDLRSKIEHRRAVVARKLAERAEHRSEADRLHRFGKPYDDAIFRVTQFTAREMAENQARIIASARQALAMYGLDGEQSLAEDKPALLEKVRLVLGEAEHARLGAACYELLLIRAEAEATSPPGRAEPGEKIRSRAEKALQVLARADVLARAHHLNTRTFHIRKARYRARSREEPFDPARIDPAAPAGPQGALDWFLAGLDHYQEGTRAEQDRRNPGESFNLASKACLETLKVQDGHYWARYVLAMCHLRGRRWIDAKMELTLCIKSRPELTWPRLMRGFAGSELGALLGKQELAEAEFDRAEIDIRSVLQEERDPLTRYVGLVNRGVLNIRRQHWQDAVNDLRQAVKVNEKGFQGYLNLARALQGLKQWNEARAALDQAIQQVPELPVLYENRAKLHLELNDRQSARADFERAVAKEPRGSKSERLVKTLVELGRLQLRDHQYKEARASLERALKLDPGYLIAQRFRAEALLGQHQHAEAGRALDEYMKQEKEPSAKVYKARGLIHAANGQLSRAIQCYSAAFQRNPDDSETLRHRGWAYLLTDATQLAMTDFEACLKKNANDAEALAGRGNAHIRCARLEEALADAEEAKKQGPLTDRLLYNLACIYSRAAGQLRADPRTLREPAAGRRLATCEERAVALLHLALEKLSAEQRASYWRTKVEPHPAFAAIRRLEGYLRLARQYRRPGQ